MAQVSVVIPAFNAAETVERAVQSVLDQTFKDLEVVVIDDGSTDGTLTTLRRLTDSRLRVLESTHHGVAETANIGTRAATAPLIARMDADDYSHPDRLRRQVELLRECDADVVGCQVRIVGEKGGVVESMQRYERWINEETLSSDAISALRFVELPIVNPTILAKRGSFELGCRSGDFPEDYDLMLRAAEAGMRFAKVPDVLFDWSDRPERLTRTDRCFTSEAFMACRRHHLLNGPLKGVETVDLWGVGQTGKPWLRWLQSEQIRVRRAFDVSDRKVGRTIHGVCVESPFDLPPPDGTPLIVAVGAAGARELIVPHVESRGYTVGGDVWFVA